MKITFKVFDTFKNKYVTQDKDWLIDSNGKLLYNDGINCVLVVVSQSRYRVDMCVNDHTKDWFKRWF